MHLVVSMLACSAGRPAPVVPVEPPPAPGRLQFASLPLTDALNTAVVPTLSAAVNLDGAEQSVGLHVVARSGVDGFGDILARGGERIDTECHEQDFNSLIWAHDRPFLVSHFECVPGAVVVTPMNQDAQGMLTPDRPVPVDFDDVGGVWLPCAGQATAWGTHLGSEEYEPDARAWQADGSFEPDRWGAWAAMLRYWPDPADATPYQYGYITEVRITDAAGSSIATKHGAMGRFSHELGFVVGDDRTAYLSDDGSAVGLFLFVADAQRDMTAGRLYAARMTQAAPDATLAVSWIPLGHATDAEVAGWVAARIRFSEIFDAAEPDEAQACPDGFTWVGHSFGVECLRLAAPSERVPDPARVASRLETRRYAALLGATTELEKGEGVTWDPQTATVYLALSSVSRRMLAEPDAPSDHIAWTENTCGVVLSGRTAREVVDSEGVQIPSAFAVVEWAPELAGRPLSGPDAQGNLCDPEGIANPDNLTFLPGYGLLTIGEDTRRHRVAALWTHDVRSKDLVRILASPPGGEVTGLHWIPDLGGFGYLTVAVQHPWGEMSRDAVIPAGVTEDDKRSFTGWIGPFPSLAR